MYFPGETGGQNSKEMAARTRSESDIKFHWTLHNSDHEITLHPGRPPPAWEEQEEPAGNEHVSVSSRLSVASVSELAGRQAGAAISSSGHWKEALTVSRRASSKPVRGLQAPAGFCLVVPSVLSLKCQVQTWLYPSIIIPGRTCLVLPPKANIKQLNPNTII